MPDVFTLNAAPSLARLRVAEVAIATANDDDDARAGTLAKLGLFGNRLGVERGVIDALDLRLRLRPPLPVLETTQNLVRRARRRLEQERLGVARAQNDVRRLAVTRLQAVLEP
jgi:hypothetical protein